MPRAQDGKGKVINEWETSFWSDENVPELWQSQKNPPSYGHVSWCMNYIILNLLLLAKGK